MKTITKQQELLILADTIEALGPHSYLGPWLREVRAEVEQQVRSDFFPSVTLAESRRQAEAIVAEAKADAARLVENAHAARERSNRAIDEQKEEAARQLAQASEQLKRLATSLIYR